MDVKEILKEIELRLQCGWPNPMARQTIEETAAIIAHVREMEARAEKADGDNRNMATMLAGYHQLCSEHGFAPSSKALFDAAKRAAMETTDE